MVLKKLPFVKSQVSDIAPGLMLALVSDVVLKMRRTCNKASVSAGKSFFCWRNANRGLWSCWHIFKLLSVTCVCERCWLINCPLCNFFLAVVLKRLRRGAVGQRKVQSGLIAAKEPSRVNVARVSAQSYGTWLCLHCLWFMRALTISISPSQ